MNILISFASHPEFDLAKRQYHASVLENMVRNKDSDGFDLCVVYGRKDLPGDLLDFCLANPRGFGYWAWKPYVIMKALQEHPGAHVFYSDILYRVQPDAKPGALARKMRGPCVARWTPHPLSHWCHSKAINRIDPRVRIFPPYLETGFSIWTAEAMPILREWYFWCCELDVVGDQPGENHRHDTSIFSLIAGKYEESHWRESSPTLWDKDIDPKILFMDATPEAHAARKGIGHA